MIRRITSDCTDAELQLLFTLAKKWNGCGLLYDVGCGNGGSTVALAKGLADAGVGPQKQIRAFDLFEYYSAKHASLEQFSKYTKAFSKYIDVYPGNIETIEFTPARIEILFIDIAKTINTHKCSVRRFLPYLSDNGALLNQDFGRPHLFWIHYAFLFLSEHFKEFKIVDDTILLKYPGNLNSQKIYKVSRDDFEFTEKVALIENGRSTIGHLPARGGVYYKDILALSLFFLYAESGHFFKAKLYFDDFFAHVPNPPANLSKVVRHACRVAEERKL